MTSVSVNTASSPAAGVIAPLRRAGGPAAAPAIARFPDFPPRADMMNPRHLHDQGHQPALRRHLGNPDTTIVLGEVPIAWEVPRGRAGVRIPDLLIAFNIRRDDILEQRGYAISEQGKPPDFVLEVASDTTARNDERGKLLDYARFGVQEYWLFDPDWGRRYATGLAGWTLVDGIYRPIAIRRHAAAMHYGRSAVLGLQVCWEYGALRWYDAAAQEYLDTFDSIADARAAERDGRIAAEAEVERLRDEIARLRGRGG